MPPKRAGLPPPHRIVKAGDLGAESVFFRNEIKPLMAWLEELNDWLREAGGGVFTLRDSSSKKATCI